MTRTHELPAGLGSWAESLAPLVPELSHGLLPLIHGIDDLVQRQDVGGGNEGPLDGYDGLTTRGIPDRILMSEWVLADEHPMEFLRRASNGELLHLNPAYRRPQPRGRVVVLVDVGPDQLGGPRLVQLASLVVLHRRAVAHGTEIAVGLLGGRVDAWLEGDLGPILRSWRNARERSAPTVHEVAAREAELDKDDQVWLLTSPSVARQLPERRRVLSAVEATWGPEGAESFHVTLDRDSVELASPSRKLGVRALRGAAFRTDAAPVITTERGLRVPRFNSAERKLLLRGDRADVIYGVTVPLEQASVPKLKRHVLTHPVVAASALNRRLVAVVVEDGHLRVRVIGKQLWDLHEIAVPIGDVGFERVDVEELPPVYIHEGSVILRVRESWWSLSTKHGVVPRDLLAVAPGHQQDQPQLAAVGQGGVWVANTWQRRELVGIVFGTGNHYALQQPAGPWSIYRGAEEIAEIDAGAGDVLALVNNDSLLTVTQSGLVLRLASLKGIRTLTRWSGGIGVPSVHPTAPMVAVCREGYVEVGNILTGVQLMMLRDGDA